MEVGLVTGTALVLGAALLALWFGSSRRYAAERARRSADWEGSGNKPELWTLAARCPHCGAHGGLLELEGDETWFVCLACRQRHRRQSRA
ncbi:MAG: hypothetical protein M3493_05420 [Actinomycetota bacterium]|jgi:hypothetical protein|nr:hypothetical protein [Euzebyaceae bacterium]MDQ3452129.1 hypothetical protein [Actinomycetota bacterium]